VRTQPEQQAPPVQRLRLRYAKRGRMRFTSHRDFSRAFERALFRARIPMAYSSGFNPHPRISYAGASPTGAASEAEYVEIALAQVVDPAGVLAALDQAMPDGLDLLEVAPSPGGGLAELLQASEWVIDLPVPASSAETAVAAFLVATEVRVERMTKKGLREFDARGAVVALRVAPGPSGPSGPSGGSMTRLELVLRHTEPAVRPDDVVAALDRVGGLEMPPPDQGGLALLTRLAQGPFDEATGTIGDPLAVNGR
jgi:radical SAM-linked protein